MKYVICLFVLIAFSSACQPSKDSDATAFLFAGTTTVPLTVTTENLKKVFCQIDLGEAESDIINNRAFLFKYHFSPNLDDFPDQSDWKHMDSIYNATKLDTIPESKRDLFKQLAAITILRNHALLADTTEKGKIAAYTEAYVESGGKSAGLLYYCLITLGDVVDDTQKKAYINAVTPRAAQTMQEFKEWMKVTKNNIKNESFPLEVVDLLKTDFTKVEQIIRDEEAFIRQLKAM